MIRFTKHKIVGKELEYIEDALKRGIGGGYGKYNKLCESFIEEKFGIKRALLTPSCSHALEMIAILIGTKPGDEFIAPSFTYVTTVSEFVKFGGIPVLVDIREDTLNMDEDMIENLITDKTKAIVVVHYAGVAASMEKILSIAKRHDLLVIEDAAQGVNAKYKDRYLGSLGSLGCYSFHETKNYSMGEGGALLINDEIFKERAEILRDRGTDKSKFMKGMVSSYKWVDLGAGYYASDLNAAVLWARFEKLDWIQNKREEIWKIYYNGLKELEEKGYIKLPKIPEYSRPNWHIFYFLVKDEKTRDKIIDFLQSNGIQAVFHYIPLHISPFYKRNFKEISLPVTERVYRTIVRLPLNETIETTEAEYVVETVKKFFKES